MRYMAKVLLIVSFPFIKKAGQAVKPARRGVSFCCLWVRLVLPQLVQHVVNVLDAVIVTPLLINLAVLGQAVEVLLSPDLKADQVQFLHHL